MTLIYTATGWGQYPRFKFKPYFAQPSAILGQVCFALRALFGAFGSQTMAREVLGPNGYLPVQSVSFGGQGLGFKGFSF